VRHLPRCEDELARMQRPRVVADPQRQLALEEVEALVLVEVDVQRRLAAGRGDGLDEREAAGVRGGGVDADSEPELCQRS